MDAVCRRSTVVRPAPETLLVLRYQSSILPPHMYNMYMYMHMCMYM